MREKLKKFIELVGGVIILFTSMLVYQEVKPESFLSYEEQAAELEEIKTNLRTDYVGKPAGETIPRLESQEEFERLIHEGYATITTDELIPTGVYRLLSWRAFDIVREWGKIGHVRKKRNTVSWETKWPLSDAVHYQEFYLARLSDSTHVLTVLSPGIERELREKGEITLPVGRKDTVYNKGRKLLSAICSEYEADPVYYLHMTDNTWLEEQEGIRVALRFIPAAAVFFLLIAGLKWMTEKLFSKGD